MNRRLLAERCSLACQGAARLYGASTFSKLFLPPLAMEYRIVHGFLHGSMIALVEESCSDGAPDGNEFRVRLGKFSQVDEAVELWWFGSLAESVREANNFLVAKVQEWKEEKGEVAAPF